MHQQEQAEARGDVMESKQWEDECLRRFGQHGAPPPFLGLSGLVHLQMTRSEAWEIAGDMQQAIQCYQTALGKIPAPDSIDAVLERKLFMGLSRVAFLAGQYEMSIGASGAALEMNCHFDEAHKYKALSLQALDRLGEAVETMNRAVLYETPWNVKNTEKALKLYQELVAEQQSCSSAEE